VIIARVEAKGLRDETKHPGIHKKNVHSERRVDHRDIGRAFF
jgi:hypothetical protein